MDNYPDHLAPDMDVGGGVATPFEEWWPRVRDSFPTVPEEVAREWLHRHWGQSPYEELVSADYSFERVRWPTDNLLNLRYRMNKFDIDHTSVLARGDFLVNEHRKMCGGTWITNFVLEHGDFPTPPIVLDNRDSHLVDHQYGDPTIILRPFWWWRGTRGSNWGAISTRLAR